MQLHPSGDHSASHPPTDSVFDDRSPGCQRRACRHRRWRLCGRPGCSGLRAYPQARGDTGPNRAAGEAGVTS